MNYTINQTQAAHTITVHCSSEAFKKDIGRSKENHIMGETTMKKLISYAENRNILVYQLGLSESEEINIAHNNDSWEAYYISESYSEKGSNKVNFRKQIVISSSIPETAKIDILLYLLCLREVFNKYWQLYYMGVMENRSEFNGKVDRLMCKVNKLLTGKLVLRSLYTD